MKALLTTALAAMAIGSSTAVAAPDCPTALTTDQAVQLQTRVFDAVGRADRTAWEAIAAPDLRAFERGKEYTRDQFFDLVLAAQRSGRHLRWSVTQPKLEADCNLAVLSYVNEGSMAVDGGAPTPMRWLETAAFRRTGDGWRLFQVTSDRVADTPGS